ncbi:intracellular hyaluronan-binding protein 4-like [Simochromis diagramma]|uniref:intracellular hyaluronan-binding protein 4-like n=1 Tax=Simochromis diagramma TaxID=43689 RepID=UPI001A7E268D|nr:intracellular hyaluronan-binding protein 4-like [Simochromis diagramma]XP_039906615.1 intracellular hyaluronan-binding protein 4-like [Simochromis diagramma]
MLPDAYGCAVANRFGNLLDDDTDPFDLINEVESEKTKKKKKKKEEEEKKAKQKKPGQKESQRDRRLPMALDVQEPVPVRRQLPRPAPVSESGEGREEAQKKAAAGQCRANQEEPPQEFSVSRPSYNSDFDLRGKGGIKGRRAGRAGGNARNPDYFILRGKREYDRHNGTGIPPDDKRGGRGAWNWGSVEEAASEFMDVTSPIKSEESQITVEEDNPNQATEEEGEMLVQVAMEMTLDEWKATQEMSRPKAEFNIRKAEGKIPSKAKVIHESKHVETIKVNMEDEGNFLRRSVNDITSLLDINFGSLGRPTRGGRGRGARGGPSRRPESVKPILERAEDDLAPNPDDPEDFPALSAGR